MTEGSLYFISTFIISPIFTVLIELLYLKKRVITNKDDAINITLINLITNIALNIILTFASIKIEGLFLILLILMLELYIPIIEYQMFKSTKEIEKKYLLHFYIANIISYFSGVLMKGLNIFYVITIIIIQLFT